MNFSILFLIVFVFGRSDVAGIPGNYHQKIVGGFSIETDDQFPYQASLRTSVLNTHFCGAFILTERWLGTAGHCTDKKQPSAFIAVVGATGKSKEYGTKHNIIQIATHPDFDSKTLRNDISMVKTENFIEFTVNVKPVKMQAMPLPSDSEAIVSGWGYIDSSSYTSPEKMQWLKVKTISLEDCREKMSKQNSERVFSTNVCAMTETTASGHGACMGDSGGPLVSDGALIAIVSWGVPCGKGLPDVYTHVSAFKDWIDSVIDFPAFPEYEEEPEI